MSREYIVGGPLGATYVSETGTLQYIGPSGYVAETTSTGGVSVNISGQALTMSVGDVTVTAVTSGKPKHSMHYQRLRRAA